MGISTVPGPEKCPVCGSPMHRPGKRSMRLNDILAANEDLSVCYILLEQFSLAYGVKRITKLYRGMKVWMKLARQSGVPELLSFCNTVEKHLMGIVYHAKFPISSGKVEGVNNMIKTIKRKSYGYRDTEYFFLEIKFASMKVPINSNPTLFCKDP